MPSELENAWAAGLLDGDGSVNLCPAGKETAFRKPMVVVDSTDLEILEELQRLYGGKLIEKRKQRSHHRQGWSWRVYGTENILAMLAEVLPYMRCAAKAERARLLVEEYHQVTARNGGYSPELRARKVAFEERFMAVGRGRGSQCRPGEAEDEGVEPSGVIPARLSRPVAHR